MSRPRVSFVLSAVAFMVSAPLMANIGDKPKPIPAGIGCKCTFYDGSNKDPLSDECEEAKGPLECEKTNVEKQMVSSKYCKNIPGTEDCVVDEVTYEEKGWCTDACKMGGPIDDLFETVTECEYVNEFLGCKIVKGTLKPPLQLHADCNWKWDPTGAVWSVVTDGENCQASGQPPQCNGSCTFTILDPFKGCEAYRPDERNRPPETQIKPQTVFHAECENAGALQ